jgi:hypothetical protein
VQALMLHYYGITNDNIIHIFQKMSISKLI